MDERQENMRINNQKTILNTTHSSLNGANRLRRPRVALYSHDTQGLGHIRRNLVIAKALSGRDASPVILLLSGLHEAAAFTMPDGVDCLTLPALGKNVNGSYFPRSLGVSMDNIIQIRSQSIDAALQAFKPDLFVVDKVPLGVFDELKPSLNWLRNTIDTKLVLGLRGILDDPLTVRDEWDRGNYEASIRKLFHRIWVYSDQDVFDPIQEYSFASDIAGKVRFTGYLNPADFSIDVNAHKEDCCIPVPREMPEGRFALCVVGGGRDGVPLAESFVRSKLPDGLSGLLITGPLMGEQDRSMLMQLAATRSNIRIVEFVTNPIPFIMRAECVIAMGGYNTMCETVCAAKPTLIVPRCKPRTEQLIRAERFKSLGLVDVLHPEVLNPGALTNWLANPKAPKPGALEQVNFNGIKNLPSLLEEALSPQEVSEGVNHVAC